jgi:hypothetical protein
MNVDEKLYSCDASDDEVDEDPPQDDAPTLGVQISGQETRRRIKKLIERWRARGTTVSRAYAYELERLLD